MYGYPRVFPIIERDHPQRHRERVEELIKAERYEDAERFAAFSAQHRAHDPEAWHTLAIARIWAGDADGMAEAAARAVAIRQTMDGEPTRRPRYHMGARLKLSRHALQTEDWVAAAGHLELGRRFHEPGVTESGVDALAFAYERLGLPLRAAALRGGPIDADAPPRETVTLDAIRQYRPWAPCQLDEVRLGLHEDGRVDIAWSWGHGREILPPVQLSTHMNEAPMEILAQLGETALGDDALDALPLTLPGWQTTPHMWHEGSRVHLEPGSTPAIVIERDGEPGNAMIATLPVRADGGMFVAIRLRAEGAPASIAWLAEDPREKESFHDTFEPVPPGEWTWRAAYHPASHHWDATWLHVGLYDAAGAVTIDRVVMVSLPDAPADCPE